MQKIVKQLSDQTSSVAGTITFDTNSLQGVSPARNVLQGLKSPALWYNAARPLPTAGAAIGAGSQYPWEGEFNDEEYLKGRR